MRFKLKSKRSIFVASLLGAVMMSQSASALSCAQPNLQWVVKEAKASDKIYHVLAGRITSRSQNTRRGGYIPSANGGGFKHGGGFGQSKDVTRVTFEGVSITASSAGDEALTRFPIDVETSCAGPWCGGMPNANQEIIAFVEAREGEPPVLRIGACPKFIFPATPPNIQTVRHCLTRECSSYAPFYEP